MERKSDTFLSDPFRITKEEKGTAAWSKEGFSHSIHWEGGREGGEGMEYSMLRIDAPLAISVQQQTQGKTSVQY